MNAIWATLSSQFQQSSSLELAAVVFALLYLLLAVKESRYCWAAAFVSTTLFLIIFWDVNLYMESALQVYYLGMAAYGWCQWKDATSSEHGTPVTRWSGKQHGLALAMIAALTLASGLLLEGYTQARLPFSDSFTTWGSVVTTYMVAKKILENWLYWLVIDALSVILYLDRELYFTALLFAIYLVIICFGWFSWLKAYRYQTATDFSAR